MQSRETVRKGLLEELRGAGISCLIEFEGGNVKLSNGIGLNVVYLNVPMPREGMLLSEWLKAVVLLAKAPVCPNCGHNLSPHGVDP